GAELQPIEGRCQPGLLYGLLNNVSICQEITLFDLNLTLVRLQDVELVRQNASMELDDWPFVGAVLREISEGFQWLGPSVILVNVEGQESIGWWWNFGLSGTVR